MSNDSNKMTPEHLTAGQLAAFVSGTLDAQESHDVVAHLETCDRCAETYRSGLHVMSNAPGDDVAHRLPERILDRARRVSGTANTADLQPRRMRYALTMAGTAAALVAILLLIRPGGQDAPLTLSAFPAIEVAAAQSSSYSLLVIPGTEERISTVTPAYRSGTPAPSTQLDGALEELLQARAGAEFTREEAYALIAGELAAGNFRLANDLAQDAEQQFGRRAEFHAASGIALFYLDQLEAARAALESASAMEPDRAVHLYNLAIVAGELGDKEQRRTLATRAAATDSPLRDRALSLLRDE